MIYRPLLQSQINKENAVARYAFLSSTGEFNQYSINSGSNKYNAIKHLFYSSQTAPTFQHSKSWFNGSTDFKFLELDNIYVGDLGMIPGSINMKVNIGGGDEIVYDDYSGNLYSASTTYGNVFYQHGMILFNNTDYTIGTIKELDYNVIYEVFDYEYLIKLNPEDFNFTTNPSAFDSNDQFIFKDRAFVPIVTQINLYNDDHELIAIASLDKPLVLDIPYLIEINFTR